MLLKKIGAKNYFVALLILLGAIVATIILAFLLTAVIPDAPGRTPYVYQVETAYEFEPWTFEMDNLNATYPEGGVIVNVNFTNQYRSDLILGNAVFAKDGVEIRPENTGGLFTILEYDYFDNLRGDIIFFPVEDETLLGHIEEIASKQKGIPTIWNNTLPLNFHRDEGLAYYYFIDPDGYPILPPEGNYSSLTVLGSFLFYFLFFVAMFLALTIFSPDHRYSRYWMHLGKTPPGTVSLIIILPAAIFAGAGELLPHITGSSIYTSAAGYGLAILMLFLTAKKGMIDYLDFGLRRDRVKHGYLLALIGAIIFVFTVRGFPQGLQLQSLTVLYQLPLTFLLIGLPRELLWRGYIQAKLSRQFGVTKGLLFMSIIVAVIHYTGIMATEPWMAVYPYTYLEILVLVPGTAALLGYLYLRTENILACALMHTLIIWLPGVILF